MVMHCKLCWQRKEQKKGNFHLAFISVELTIDVGKWYHFFLSWEFLVLKKQGQGIDFGPMQNPGKFCSSKYLMKVVFPVEHCPANITIGLASKSGSSKAGKWKSWNWYSFSNGKKVLGKELETEKNVIMKGVLHCFHKYFLYLKSKGSRVCLGGERSC